MQVFEFGIGIEEWPAKQLEVRNIKGKLWKLWFRKNSISRSLVQKPAHNYAQKQLWRVGMCETTAQTPNVAISRARHSATAAPTATSWFRLEIRSQQHIFPPLRRRIVIWNARCCRFPGTSKQAADRRRERTWRKFRILLLAFAPSPVSPFPLPPSLECHMSESFASPRTSYGFTLHWALMLESCTVTAFKSRFMRRTRYSVF